MPSSEPPFQRPTFDAMGLATLAAAVATLVISFSNMREIDRFDRSIGDRIGKLEDQVAQVGSRPAAAPAAAPGADPNRVYTVRVSNDMPMKGPANAPITIAEFSDFQ
jgi:hypothetical protein